MLLGKKRNAYSTTRDGSAEWPEFQCLEGEKEKKEKKRKEKK